MTKKNFLLYTFTCCLFFLGVNALCQQNAGILIMGIPQVYIRPELIPTEDNIMGILAGSRWQVFSERNDNAVYADFNGTQVKSRAKFLEAFYVTNVKGDFLHIYSDPNPEVNGNLSVKAAERGWINKSNVLLWHSSLLVMQMNSKKQMQVMTLGQTDFFDMGQTNDSSRKGIAIYRDPGFKDKTGSRTDAKQLYFVYKTEKNALLIGTEKKILVDTDPAEVILGWIARDNCYILDSRVWVSENSSLLAVDERQSKHINPVLFLDETHAKQYRLNQVFDQKFVIWQRATKDKSTERQCFPLIEKKAGIVKVKIIEDDFKTGFGASKPDWMENDLFRMVTLINTTELNTVTINMRALLDNISEPIDRNALKKSLLSLYKKDKEDLRDDAIYNLPVREIFENLFWIVNSDDPMLTLPFSKVDDPGMISEPFLKSILQSVSASEKTLLKIVNSDNSQQREGSFISHDLRYYWLDLSLFP